MGLRISLVVFLLTLTLFGIIGIKQWTLHHGKPITLQVDNSDLIPLFTGEVVRIRYNINAIPLDKLAEEDVELNTHEIVYVVLKKGITYWEPEKVYLKKPNIEPDEIVLKGEITNRNFDSDMLYLKYGIENYSISANESKKLEKPGTEDKIGVQVVVDRFGNAAIRAVLVNDQERYVEKLF